MCAPLLELSPGTGSGTDNPGLTVEAEVKPLPRRKNYWWCGEYREKVFELLFKFQEGRCAYCECDMTFPVFTGKQRRVKRQDEATIDHIIPVSKGGGKWHLWNVILACNRCNAVKADRIWKPKCGCPYAEGIFGHVGGFDMVDD